MRRRRTAEEKIRAAVLRRRRPTDLNARRRANFYTNEAEGISIDDIRRRDDATCYLCGLWVDVGEMTLDHVVPLARGGTHIADNIKLAHKVCNSKKGKKLLSEIDFSKF